MIGVVCVYGGGLLALAGALALLGRRRSRTRGQAAALVAGGLALTAVGALLPAPRRRAGRRSRLDDFLPEYEFCERHVTAVDRQPEQVYAAIKATTAREVLLFETLTWIRRFGRPLPEGILHAPRGMPLIDVATRGGFLTLAEEPGREIVIGMVVIAPGPLPADRTPEWFRQLAEPGFAKAAMNFVVEPRPGGGSLVMTETRVAATDARTRRRFAAYWRVIYPGSSLIRHMWLRAIRRRAEAATAAPASPRGRMRRSDS